MCCVRRMQSVDASIAQGVVDTRSSDPLLGRVVVGPYLTHGWMQWRRQAWGTGARAPWSLRMHANFADLTPDGFHVWTTLSPRTSEPVRHAPGPPGAKFWRRHWFNGPIQVTPHPSSICSVLMARLLKALTGNLTIYTFSNWWDCSLVV